MSEFLDRIMSVNFRLKSEFCNTSAKAIDERVLFGLDRLPRLIIDIIIIIVNAFFFTYRSPGTCPYASGSSSTPSVEAQSAQPHLK
jgi:hypothetical protein